MICPHRSAELTPMSPIPAKATPTIVVDYENIEVDAQSSTENQDDGSSALTDDIADDWSLFGDENECNELFPAHLLTPLTNDLQPNSLYSFYFVDTHTTIPEDDMSITLDDVSFGGADSLLDGKNESSDAAWSNHPTLLTISNQRRLSPAQVSLSSLDFGQLQHACLI
jgi:hypothetical protein